MRHLLHIALLLFMSQSGLAAQVIINELMSLNTGMNIRGVEVSADWIELYNPSDVPVDLTGWYLSDDADELDQWQLPDTIIPVGGYLLVLAEDDEQYPGFIQSNFGLSSDGESVYLTDPSGQVVDSSASISLSHDVSYGRVSDGDETWTIFYQSSPDMPNSMGQEEVSLTLSEESGFYTSAFDLEISSSHPAAEIYYTRNGDRPHPDSSSSILYNAPFTVELRPNASYSYIPTTPADNYGYFRWTAPQSEVERHPVIRVAAFVNGQAASPTSSASYFLSDEIEARHELAILSVMTDSTGLFAQDSGIFVPGIHHVAGEVKSGNYHERGRAWERPASFELLSPDGERLYSTDIGMRNHGNLSRAAPQKGLRFIMRKSYCGSDELGYPLFENRGEEDGYKVFISRSLYSAHEGSVVRDEIAQEIVEDLDLDYQASFPVATYINGEYWGIQVLREKQDEHYLELHYDVDMDALDIAFIYGIIEHGEGGEYWSLREFVENNELSEAANYAYFSSLVDIDSYIDYYITELFFANTDWPANNYKLWKEQGTGHQWRWFLYDLDASMKRAPDFNPFYRATVDSLGTINEEWSVVMFRNVLQNENFRSQFVNRFVSLLNSDLSTERTLSVVEKWKNLVAQEIPHTTARWNYPYSQDEWEESISDIEGFLLLRTCYMKDILESYFELESLDVQCTFPERFTGITLFPNPSTGPINLISEEPIAGLVVYDMLGHQVLKQPMNGQLSYSLHHDLSAGLYLAEVELMSGQREMLRLLIE